MKTIKKTMSAITAFVLTVSAFSNITIAARLDEVKYSN